MISEKPEILAGLLPNTFQGASGGAKMNDPQTFPELNLPALEKLAYVWGQRYPAIKSIWLYQGVDKNHEYVLVTEADEVAQDDPTYPEYREYEKDWNCPVPIHIQDDLSKLYRRSDSKEFPDNWFCWLREQGKELPKDLIAEKFSWHLYTKPEPEGETESIPPVNRKLCLPFTVDGKELLMGVPSDGPCWALFGVDPQCPANKNDIPLVLTPKWQEEIAEKARESGFIALGHLADLLAYDAAYNHLLPKLWYNSRCFIRGPQTPDISSARTRIGVWNALLNKWAYNLLGGVRDSEKNDFLPIENKHGEKIDPDKEYLDEVIAQGIPYVRLGDLQDYLAKKRIPLPSLLFGSRGKEEETAGNERTAEEDQTIHSGETENIPPVHPGELGRLKESALKDYVQKMVKVLGRFPITRVELHLFDRSSEDLRGDMSWINQNAKYALLFILRNEQHQDTPFYMMVNTANLRLNKWDENQMLEDLYEIGITQRELSSVYEITPVNYGFIREWCFFSMFEGQKEIPTGVDTKGPCWVLYPEERSDKQKSMADEAIQNTTPEDFDSLISSLKFSNENDIEIIIQQPGKKPVSYDPDRLGFRNAEQKTWRTLVDIIRQEGVYSVGPSKNKAYDANQKMLSFINDKLVAFLNKEFNLNLPRDYKLYGLSADGRTGTYRFKFKFSKENAPPEFSQADKEKLQKQIETLHMEWKKTGDSVYYEKLRGLLGKAYEAGILTENELRELLSTEAIA